MPLSETLSCAEMMKMETKSAHQAAEVLIINKLKAIKSVEEYASLLRLFYGFYAPLEHLIAAYIQKQVLPDFQSRRKSGLILTDLSQLQQHGVNRLCTDLPQVQSLAQAFGALYVLEGSTLGGKIIAVMLAKNPNVQLQENVLSFFRGYGEETEGKWLLFQQHMWATLVEVPEVREAITTAQQTFSKFRSWIQKFD